MDGKEFLLKIQAHSNLFTKAEKKVADYILQHPRDVLFMSITDLADACQVGDTSVFRFCKTMGLQGYQEFKMNLSLSMDADPMKEDVGDLQSADLLEADAQHVVDHVLQTNISALRDTAALLKVEELSKAVDWLVEAREVHFFGVGSSMLTAMEGVAQFMRVTGKVRCTMDAHMQAMSAALMTPRDVAVVISYSGSTKDTIHVAELAKHAGARVIAITRFVKSPLTSFADLTILCGANEGPLQSGSTSGKVSQLFLLNLLFTGYYRRTNEDSTSHNQMTSRAVVDKLY